MLHIVRIASLRICFWFKGQDLTFDNLKLKYLSLWGLKLGSNLSDKFVANLFFKMEGSKTKNKATKQFEAPGHLKSYVFMSKLELYEWRGDTKNGIKNPWAIISNEPCDSQLAEPIQNFNHENGVWEYHFIIIMSTKKSSSCVYNQNMSISKVMKNSGQARFKIYRGRRCGL